jgi:hypothetical protein
MDLKFDRIERLVGTDGATMYAEAYNARDEHLFSIFSPDRAFDTEVAMFLRRVLIVSGSVNPNPQWKQRADDMRAKVAYIGVVNHWNRELYKYDAKLLLQGQPTVVTTAGSVGNSGYKRDYATYIDSSAFVLDFSFRDPINTNKFFGGCRVTAADGRAATSVIHRAMTGLVINPMAGSNGWSGSPLPVSKIVMRMCGIETVWLRNAASGRWKGKGAFAVLTKGEE